MADRQHHPYFPTDTNSTGGSKMKRGEIKNKNNDNSDSDNNSAVAADVSSSYGTILSTVTTALSTKLAVTSPPAQENTDTAGSDQQKRDGVSSDGSFLTTDHIISKQKSQSYCPLEEDRKPEALSTNPAETSNMIQKHQASPSMCVAETNDEEFNKSNCGKTVAKKKRVSRTNPGANDGSALSTGRWTDAEHQAFLRGLQLYGREWKKVASHIPTRTSAQVRSHAQKHFVKMQRDKDSLMILSSVRNSAHDTSSDAMQRIASAAPGERIHLPAESQARNLSTGAGIPPAREVSLARILSNPQRVEAEVEETMQRLNRRYRQLQERLLHIEQEERSGSNLVPLEQTNSAKGKKRPADSTVEKTIADLPSTHGLADNELIALSVLHGSLPRSSGSSHESNETTSEHGTLDTNNSCCSSNMKLEDDEGVDENAASDESHASSKRQKSTGTPSL